MAHVLRGGRRLAGAGTGSGTFQNAPIGSFVVRAVLSILNVWCCTSNKQCQTPVVPTAESPRVVLAASTSWAGARPASRDGSRPLGAYMASPGASDVGRASESASASSSARNGSARAQHYAYANANGTFAHTDGYRHDRHEAERESTEDEEDEEVDIDGDYTADSDEDDEREQRLPAQTFDTIEPFRTSASQHGSVGTRPVDVESSASRRADAGATSAAASPLDRRPYATSARASSPYAAATVPLGSLQAASPQQVRPLACIRFLLLGFNTFLFASLSTALAPLKSLDILCLVIC